MRVLNWVTRRLLNVVVPAYDDMESTDYVNSKFNVEETQALLKHGGHMVMDVVEDWKEGILTIGTLAIGPLETTNVEEDDDDTTEDLHDRHVLEHESNPLMNVALFSHEEVKEVNGSSCKEIIEDQVIAEDVPQTEDKGNVETELDTKTRVTLADLFLADSGHKLVKQLGDHQKEIQGDVSKDVNAAAKPCLKKMIKPNCGGQSGLKSKAKKLLKEDLHPVKKLNQLMKRMTKKKIHPDVEGKIQGMLVQPSNDAPYTTDM